MKKVVIFFLLCSSLFLVGCNKKGENKEENKNKIISVTKEDVIKETSIEDLSIYNVSLIYKGGITSYSAKVENKSDDSNFVSSISINIYENNELIDTLTSFVGGNLEKGNVFRLNASTTKDLSKADKIEYVLNK